MRDVSEIITRNALQAIKEEIHTVYGEGRVIDERGIAARMAEFMGLPTDSVMKGLNRYLRQGHPWRVDYIEALALATRRTVQWFTELHGPGDVVEASGAAALFRAVDARISNQERRVLAVMLNDIVNHRPLFDLTMKVMRVLLDAESAAGASLSALDLIRNSNAWSGNVRDLRGKRIAPKKS